MPCLAVPTRSRVVVQNSCFRQPREKEKRVTFGVEGHCHITLPSPLFVKVRVEKRTVQLQRCDDVMTIVKVYH